MKVTMIGSHLCPDTFAAMSALLAAGVEVSYKDILSCHADLKTYLKLRDTNKIYAEIRGTDMLGIPCFILEDGNITLNLAEVLKLTK
mgnify:FL=1